MARLKSLSLMAAVGLFSVGCAGTAQRPIVSNEQLMQEIEALKEKEEQDPLALEKIDQLRAQVEALREDQDKKLQTLSNQNVSLETRVALLSDQVRRLEESVKSLSAERISRRPATRVETSYRKGLQDYYAKKFDQAISGFSQIIATAPKGKLADNAQYWIGECYYGLENFRQALAEFQKVFAYPETDKDDDAQLKIGYCYLKLGDRAKASAEFKRFLADYPNSEYAPDARRMIAQIEGH